MKNFNSWRAAAILSAASFSVLMAPNAAFAHVTSVNGVTTSGPIITDAPQTLAAGKIAASVSYQRFDLDGFSDEELEGSS